MFTGIIEATGKIIRREAAKNSTRLTIEAGSIAKKSRIGDSIAVNGCCLTVVEINEANLTFDLLQETEDSTNLKEARAGMLVNLEPAMPADGRFGGHFVTGHVDGATRIHRFSLVNRDYELAVEIQPAWGAWLVPKGCIAIDGISLTVAEVHKDAFTVWIIPHTREITALREKSKGDRVNLEFDLLAKYTEKILATRSGVV
jgi:riboflavin synthase